uniref:RNA exonuclease 4 n=1 Tax=Maylandia zebra TaxID=106582 RepID=A0A3P9C2Z4_9CICH
VIMSKVEKQKKHFPAQASKRKTNKKNGILKKNERHWFYSAPANKEQEKPTAPQTAPPKDSQQFSANWKALQEVSECNSLSSMHVLSHTLVFVCLCLILPTGFSLLFYSLQLLKASQEDLWFDDVDPDDIEATMGAEAAEIMRKKQGKAKGTDGASANDTEKSLVKENAFEGLTKAVAIDCEMVGVGPDGEDSILARVSIVNQFGKCIYDKYVKPTEKVTDYRTAVSGIRPEDIKDGADVQIVQREVANILEGRVVVGHAIHNDLKILLLDHPKKKIRDTQKYKPFKTIVKSGRPSLKLLCRKILDVKVQEGEHSSVQDAQATMRLYTMVKKQWEAEIKVSSAKASGSTADAGVP